MVVVAGGDGHEIPMCVVTEEKDWSNLVFLDKDSRAQMECRTIEFERRRNAMTNRLDMKEIVVIVGDECTLDAQVNDDFVDLSMIFRFSPSSTVKQLKYAIATRFQDIPVLDSFCIHIKSDLSEDSIELVGDNKTIKEFDLVHTNEMKIFIKRIRKEDRTEHRRVCKNDTFLEMLVVNHISLKTPNWLKILFVNEANTVHQLFDNLQEEISVNGYKKEDMCLRSSGITMTKDDYDKTLGEMGFDFSECASVTLLIRKDNTEDVTEASGQGYYIMPNSDWIRPTDKKITLTEILKVPGGKFGRRESPEVESKPETVYVGLINQAMTCYLNSLLQALFMTPEFRNALYNWEYVDGSEKDAANSIPYQLQKLFLNLQTSKKNAVETTSLTKSFGWDSTEAWQQHDIQELCRVMFDALEQKFKNTKQADLINRLYEGKMIDYVKCLECGTEKSREDTFLDIPLPVKPFGSAVAYNSVEEALRAFVQPETLDGVNQYFCETCNKKCDAHKGLKFKKFPYILTLHLKRFDFDYNTFHRIKLNDKVTFPDVLNVNSLIPSSTDNLESPSTEEDAGTGVKCDDSSTTDSGNLDESLPCDNGIITSQNNLTNNDQDDDEGIYISNCPSTSSIHSQENDRNRNNRNDCGFHKYDLFSIMIHSGSASGGHYYAYIKDFKTQEWLCFNDQNVSPITLDDIRKTYGGGPSRAFYSGAYSTSTNAYMLMYRQIDYERNCLPMTVDDFPKHIQLLLKQMKEQEEKKHHDRTRQMYKISIYCHHPVERMLCTARIFSVHEELLSETVEKVWSAFSLDHVVSLDQCRLVNYDPTYDIIECSYEGREDETIGSIIQSSRTYESNRPRVPDMLLEIRRKDKKFENYKPVEITTTVFVADVIARKIVDGPFTVRVPLTISVADYKKILGKLTRIHLQQMCLAGGGLTKDGKKIETSDSKLCEEGFYSGCKIFIETRLDVDKTKPFRDITPKSMWDLYDNIVMMHVYMPNISEEIMKEFNIPAWESEKKEKETDKSIGIAKLWNSDAKIERNDLESIPQKNKDDEVVGENEEWQEQSNSEDSSLSDSDRTLVGDASEDDDFAGLSNVDHELYSQTANDCKDINENLAEDFLGIGEKYGDPVERLKIYVHRQMKRNTLKKKLEPILKVPIKYFKIIRQIVENNEITGVDIRTPTGAFSNNETLTIKLCRAIRDGDFTMRLYLLRLKRNSAMDHEYLCEFMVFKNSTVEHIKREMIVTLKENHNIDIPYERLRLRKKQSETPGAILLDDMTIEIFMKIDEDLDDLNSGEFFVQELPDKEIVTNSNQIVLFAWRYYPAFKKWDEELHEIVRETRSIAEIKTKLSEISGIPVDKVTFTRGRFPINSSYECQWRQECLEHWEQFSEDDWTTWCGLLDTIFYKDSSEGDSTILTEEDCSSRSINHRRVRRTRFDDPSWSPRRERALKIFVDDK